VCINCGFLHLHFTFAGLVLSVTRLSLLTAADQFRVYMCVCVCVCVCVSNYSSQTTEPICVRIIPANRASYADCYRLLRFEIFTKYDYCPRERAAVAQAYLRQWQRIT